MEKQRLLIPLTIGGIVVSIWLAYRSRASTTVIQQQPGTSGSGVPAYTPQAQAFNVSPLMLGPTPGMTLFPPSAIPPQADFHYTGPQSVYNYNQGPAADVAKAAALQAAKVDAAAGGGPLAKPAAACGCGGSCCSDCSSCDVINSNFVDGRGGCLATSKKVQVENWAPLHAAPYVWNVDSSGMWSSNGITFQAGPGVMPPPLP